MYPLCRVSGEEGTWYIVHSGLEPSAHHFSSEGGPGAEVGALVPGKPCSSVTRRQQFTLDSLGGRSNWRLNAGKAL